MDKHVIILLAKGFEEVEALAPCDVLRRAGAKVSLLSVTDDLTVESSHGVKIVADGLMKDGVGNYDMIVLPGGMPGTKNLLASEAVCAEVQRASKNGKAIGAICAAPMILGRLDLLQGKQATCFPGFEEDLIGATHLDLPSVIDGNIITGRGAGTAIQFGLSLITVLFSAEKSLEIARQITLLQ